MSSNDPASTTPTTPTGKAATQERILVAATELFIGRGYDKTTVQDVADLAGVSRATVFWHFSDKGGLFREAFSRVLSPFRDSLARDLSHIDPGKRVEEQIAASDRFARDHRVEVTAFLRWALESPDFRENVITTLLDLNQRFAGALTQTLAEVAPANHDPKLLATGLMLAFDASLILSLFDPSEKNAEERSAAVAELAKLLTDSSRS